MSSDGNFTFKFHTQVYMTSNGYKTWTYQPKDQTEDIINKKKKRQNSKDNP